MNTFDCFRTNHIFNQLCEFSKANYEGISEGWTPHWVHGKDDLTKVDLPPATDECWAGKDGADPTYACDFPSGTLVVFNVGNPQFL